jgi:hypothetical protein
MWEDFEQMSSAEQEKFVQVYGAPLEWMPEYEDTTVNLWSKEMYQNF